MILHLLAVKGDSNKVEEKKKYNNVDEDTPGMSTGDTDFTSSGLFLWLWGLEGYIRLIPIYLIH